MVDHAVSITSSQVSRGKKEGKKSYKVPSILNLRVYIHFSVKAFPIQLLNEKVPRIISYSGTNCGF